MAKAFVCDHCGKFFTRKPTDDKPYTIYHGNTEMCENTPQEVDLCLTCMAAFNNFLLGQTFSPDEVGSKLRVYGQSHLHGVLGEPMLFSPSEVEKVLKGENLK